MLCDAKTTWNKQEWGVDEKIDSLVQKKAMKEVIVVAVWNIPEIRRLNYFPQKAIDFLSDTDVIWKLAQESTVKLNTTKYYAGDDFLQDIVNGSDLSNIDLIFWIAKLVLIFELSLK